MDAEKKRNEAKERAAYQRSRNSEIWVHGYVLKMNVMPAKRFVRQEAR